MTALFWVADTDERIHVSPRFDGWESFVVKLATRTHDLSSLRLPVTFAPPTKTKDSITMKIRRLKCIAWFSLFWSTESRRQSEASRGCPQAPGLSINTWTSSRQSCEDTNRNAIQGRTGQASTPISAKPSPVDRSGKWRACAAKHHALILRDLHSPVEAGRRPSK